MSSPLTPSERDGVIQSFMIGTRRRPFEVPAAFSGARPDAAILGALATVATERRFVRPLPDRPGNGTPALPDDERPLLPAETRKALAMLLALQRRGDSKLLLSAAVDLVEGFGWRLHSVRSSPPAPGPHPARGHARSGGESLSAHDWAPSA